MINKDALNEPVDRLETACWPFQAKTGSRKRRDASLAVFDALAALRRELKNDQSAI